MKVYEVIKNSDGSCFNGSLEEISDELEIELERILDVDASLDLAVSKDEEVVLSLNKDSSASEEDILEAISTTFGQVENKVDTETLFKVLSIAAIIELGG